MELAAQKPQKIIVITFHLKKSVKDDHRSKTTNIKMLLSTARGLDCMIVSSSDTTGTIFSLLNTFYSYSI